MSRLFRSRLVVAVVCAASLSAAVSCGKDASSPTAPTGTTTSGTAIRDDASLFRLVSQTDPFSRYSTFPNADEFTTGRLNGSEAHRPVIRVSLNATAAGALQSGRLPAGGRFPDGSVVFKEIKPSAAAAATVYAVMLKDSGSSMAGDGWLWAEYSPTGSVMFLINNRGSACTSCHQRERGPQNDLVRTFERQQ